MKRLIALAALAGVLGLSPVLAQTAAQPDAPAAEPTTDEMGGHRGKHGKHGDGHGRRHGGRMMQIIDANSDGVINEDEAAALAERAFMRLDRDADDSVSEAEFINPPGRGRHMWSSWFGGEEQAAVQNVRKEKFAGLDTDKNGSVTKAEFYAEAKARLIAADADKDGKVTPFEFRAAN